MRDETLYRYFRNEADPQEISRIESWLSEAPEHQKEFDAAHTLFNLMILHGFDSDTVSASGRRSSGSRPGIWRRLAGVAAVILAIVGAGYAGSLIGHNDVYDTLASQVNVIQVPAGQRMTMTLSDGTSVTMNGGSRMEYPVVFAEDQRHIRLSGEAFLNVIHDESHPFVVETFASEIEVLGTKFNVYAAEDEGRFSTTLVDGKVKVSTLFGTDYEQVILNPDEQVRYIDRHLVVSKVTAADAVSWTEGYISLSHIRFDELMCRFEDTYGVKIIMERKDIPEIGYISGKIKVSEGIDFALHILQKACDFEYRHDKDSNTVTIK